jgi:hypothetical protein
MHFYNIVYTIISGRNSLESVRRRPLQAAFEAHFATFSVTSFQTPSLLNKNRHILLLHQENKSLVRKVKEDKVFFALVKEDPAFDDVKEKTFFAVVK